MAAAAWSARGTPAEDKSEPAKPLAVPSLSVPAAADDVEEAAKAATGWRSVQYLRKRRCVLCCCGCIVTAVVTMLGQGYDLTTYTEMDATVKVLGIYKKDLQIRMDCSVNVEVAGPASVLVPGAPGGVQSKSVRCVANVS